MTTLTDSATDADEQARVRSIAFLNWAHAIDHYVILIFPTLVIGLQVIYGRSYAEMIALGTASFVAFGVFSLPAGWLADRWSRRNMMALFYFGCGGSLALAAFAPNLILLAAALFLLGVFAAIYHPVGMPMLIAAATSRGRTLAFNGVCGNVGAALAAGITAALATWFGWRAAFLAPATLCLVTGVLYLRMVPDDGHKTASRSQQADVPLSMHVMATMFGLFIVIALSAGLVFNIISVALPKIVDERIGENMPLLLVGGVATAVFLCGALAQLAMGRLVEKFPPHWLFAGVAALQFAGVWWAAHTGGLTLLLALAVSMAAIYGQVTVNDVVIARYTADAWRGRVYAVRYFLTFVSSGAAVSAIAFLYSRGGFDLVLGTTAFLALGFVVATAAVAVLVTGVEKRRARNLQAVE
ncbi:MAG: major facilitator superfamily protein [Xanthobacteraceae bacterium]|nr:major facilitator superfamily protein [Xanthobacteraceae bacterium]